MSHNNNYKVTCESVGGISAELEALWAELFQNMNNPAFIHDVRWFKAYLATHPHLANKFHVFILRHQQDVIAIFPLLYTHISRFGIKMKIWQICWPNDMGLNDFIINKVSGCHTHLQLLVDHLKKTDLPWDMLELQNISERAILSKELRHCSIPRIVCLYHHDSKFIACGSTYEETTAGMSSKFKRNNRRKFRNLEKIGKITICRYHEIGDLGKAFEQFLKVESASWKGDEKTALYYDDEQRCFYEALLEEYSGTGRCEIHTLNIDNTPIAAQFAIVSGDTLYLLKIGYNAEYRAVGPGGLLLDATLKKFSGDPKINNIHFVTGANWNDNWSPFVNKIYTYHIFNRGAKGIIVLLMEKLESRLRQIKTKVMIKSKN